MRIFDFDNSYARDLPGTYVAWKPAQVPQPRLLFLNRPLAEELGLDADALDGPDGAALFAGNRVPEGAEPLARSTPDTSSAASRRSSATVARCCSAKSSTAPAAAATSRSRVRVARRSRAAAMARPRSVRCCARC